MIIHIKNLRARTIIGVNEWEKTKRQDIVINIRLVFDGTRAAESDAIEDTVDYKEIKRRVLEKIEKYQFSLLEKMAGMVADLVLEESKVLETTVEIDKPHALRFADSVSVILTKKKD